MERWRLTGTVVTPAGLLPGGEVCVADGRIAWLGPVGSGPSQAGAATCAVGEGLICPGFIDLHVHGGDGADFMDGTPAAAAAVARCAARHGVTALLATTLTAPGPAVAAAVLAARAAAGAVEAPAGAAILGCHLEGPYLNPMHKGAQDPRYMRDGDAGELAAWLDLWPDGRHVVSLAPERAGAAAVLAEARRRGAVCALAHSDATYSQAMAAGITHVVHLFNAMRGLHHREPGAAGAALTSPHLSVELIADGVHVHPAMLALAARLAGERICLVSDAVRVAGRPGAAPQRLGELVIAVRDGAARRADGALAGSVLTLDRAVANMVRLAGVDPALAVAMASLHPARVLGLAAERGSLLPGRPAHVTVLDADYCAVLTLVGGRAVHQAF